ncbi:MAG TPA: thiolase family protein [Acidimicrobiia bacterium]|nr:thiolase family protein [Acidimicrobiia bacterium]
MTKTHAIVAGVAMTPFSKLAPVSADVLAAQAVRQLIDRTGIAPEAIDEAYFGSSKGGGLIGQRTLRFTGVTGGIPVYNVENACASSAVAFNLAHRAIVAGDATCALVVGVDKLSTLGKGTLPVQETEWDGAAGVTNPVVYALRARRYMHETGASPEDLAAVVVKSRRFADLNPVAQMKGTVSIDEVLQSKMIADPLTLYQCSPKSDGAAALLLVSSDRASELGLSGPRVRASVVKSGRFSMAERDITRPDITSRAAAEAFEIAQLGPADLDVVELHDAFSIAELLYSEELGLCAEGEAPDFVRSGASSSLAKSAHPLVNPSGGLIGRGHPVGATGVAQIVECFDQLLGEADGRQREKATTALAHVTGGGASGFDNGACAVTILTTD